MKSKQDVFNLSKTVNAFIQAIKKADIHYVLQTISTKSNIALTLFISTCYILYLFPLDFIIGKSGFFDQREALISVSGWWIFKKDAWHFPLLHTRLLNAPEGVNIAFTNSIPLLALLLKPFQYWLSKDFNYLGLWATLAYLLQALSASIVLRILGYQTLLASIAASVMALMMPVLLYQTVNVALFSHAYLLFGLGLYFHGLQNPQHYQKIAQYFTSLLIIALLTHPYLFAMTSIFYLAFLGELSQKSSRYQQAAWIALGSTIGCVITILFLGGYFKESVRVKGYGQYAMNILAPFSGGQLGRRVTHATFGQQRGFNYLGAGVLFSLLLSLIIHRDLVIKKLQQHRILIGLLSLTTLFSLSHHIFYGKQIVMRLPLFFPFTIITDLLPSSGRLFWPCGYTLMIVGLIGMLSLEKLASVLGVSLMIALQWYDTIPLRNTLYQATHQKSSPTTQWARLIQTVSAIHVYPAYGCGNQKIDDLAFWQALASRYGKRMNTAYFHRNSAKCLTKHKAFHQAFHKNHLYIVHQNALNTPSHLALAIDQGWCKKTDKGLLCIKGANYSWWKKYVPHQSIQPSPVKKKIQRPVLKKKRQYVDWPEDVW